MKIKKFIIGLVSGVITGLSVAILVTPQKGKDNRASIVGKVKSVKLKLPIKKNIRDVHVK